MSRITVHDLVHKIRPYFGQTILHRGWDYYNEDAVDDFNYFDAECVTATVYGTEPYQVDLNLKHFTRSQCDCPYDGYCKHMAAVLFVVCDYMGEQPRSFLSPNQLEMQFEAESASVKKQAVTPKSPSIAIQASDKLSDWHDFFEKQTAVDYRMNSIQQLSGAISSKLLPYGAKWPETQRLFYELNVMLFTLKKVDELLAQILLSYDNYRYYYGDLLKVTSRETLQSIQNIMIRLTESNSFESDRDKLKGTVDYIHSHAFRSGKTYVNWRDAYVLFWSALPKASLWVQQERERVAGCIEAGGVDLVQMDSYILAHIFFLIRENEDRQAMKIAQQKMSGLSFESFLIYLDSFAYGKQWERLADWLEWLGPLVKRTHSQLGVYYQLWEQAVSHVPTLAPKWEQSAVALLPSSYNVYSEYLMEQKKYKEWADLNIMCGVSPLELDKSEYKLVEKEDMRYLLPLYHHKVEQLIMEKKRDSYKMAVRHLKKMGVIYRKLKQTDRWKQYITGLSKRYSRLRAFQEELQKGKWIG